MYFNSFLLRFVNIFLGDSLQSFQAHFFFSTKFLLNVRIKKKSFTILSLITKKTYFQNHMWSLYLWAITFFPSHTSIYSCFWIWRLDPNACLGLNSTLTKTIMLKKLAVREDLNIYLEISKVVLYIQKHTYISMFYQWNEIVFSKLCWDSHCWYIF